MFSVKSYYSPLGGGGYNGGKITYSGGFTGYGVSYNGSYGDSTSDDASKADGEYAGRYSDWRAYGGSGYLTSSGTSAITKTRHSGNAFFQLEFVG